MEQDDAALRRLSRARWSRALALTGLMLIVYFGFVLLTAYDKPLMTRPLVPGLSVGILLGALVIVSAFVLTGVYVWWTNAHYDPGLRAVRDRRRAAAAAEETRE
jgi:uncharacterized membrane protein (DUF485 family)